MSRRTDSDGSKKKTPLRDQLEGIALSSESAQQLLEGPPKPQGTAFAVVWQWFSQLQGERQSSGFGVLPFSSSQILAWAQLEGLRVPLWALRCLRRIDAAYLRANTIEEADVLEELQKLTGE